MTEQRMITRSDFLIAGRFSGSRLAGRENQFVYDVIAKGKGLAVKTGFPSKKSAEKWLRKTIKLANMIKAERSHKDD